MRTSRSCAADFQSSPPRRNRRRTRGPGGAAPLLRRGRCGLSPHPAGMVTPMAEGGSIRIIPHRGVDNDCGSLEVWFADGRKSVRFYWDNLVSRRLSSNTLTREQAIEKATALAKAEMESWITP